jgi:DNA-binding transcriptional MerR regulator/methylmalonyl-CoA mutase cobalamin-binding subunit
MLSEKRHPIQVVARRTGLSPEVLRVWEKRYGAVMPGRTDTGRRVYSDEDIEHLRLLRQATVSGRRIGDVAHLTHEELERIVREDLRASREGIRARRETATTPEVEGFMEECLQAIHALDVRKLEASLGRAIVALSSPQLIEGLLAPLVRTLGELWENGQLRPYHEHLATALVRQMMGPMMTASKADPTAPMLVVTTPSGQRHEIGAILASAAALAEGWRVIYLGPDLPAADIARAVEQVGGDAVALSLVYPADDPDVAHELELLKDQLDPDTPIFVGGAGAASYAPTLRRIAATLFHDTRAFRAALREWRGGP